MPDYEELIINNIMAQLNETMHLLLEVKQDCAVIRSEQANIKADLAEHKAASDTSNKGWIQKILDVIKTWIFPIVCAIFLLGRQSVEYTNKPIIHNKSTTSTIVDDTFVSSNKKLDSLIYSYIKESKRD